MKTVEQSLPKIQKIQNVEAEGKRIFFSRYHGNVQKIPIKITGADIISKECDFLVGQPQYKISDEKPFLDRYVHFILGVRETLARKRKDCFTWVKEHASPKGIRCFIGDALSIVWGNFDNTKDNVLLTKGMKDLVLACDTSSIFCMTY